MAKLYFFRNRVTKGSGVIGGARIFVRLTLIALCISLLLTGCGRKVYSDAGKDELDCFVRLGVFPADASEKTNAPIQRFDAVLALQTLLGAGDELRIADYFRSISYSGTVDFFEDAGGEAADPESKVSSSQAYCMCLKALGYGAEIKENGSDRIGELILEAGFGSGDGSGIFSGDNISYGTYSLILREMMLLRPKGNTEAVYRVAAMMDSSFSDLLEYNGLYDDVPEDLCPAFSFGRYVPGSFSAAVSDGTREWTASYSRISEDIMTEYASKLTGSGWILEGKYLPETEQGSVIWLYYKAEESSPDGEMGLVLKLTADGTLSWNLMA